ncbi:hypothetical protein TNIN_68691 [Trichonephila inaurata madagascariensis]|uniref:Uncharacterized protein n=1 Tax=Trichonephila inaurata madagascariensis TaxID=2747483 RepID=A0A8X6X6C9_9ARAC|nr:hypothetical protein TNIN_68691 [Trichonephila inaurata madagascariensis]
MTAPVPPDDYVTISTCVQLLHNANRQTPAFATSTSIILTDATTRKHATHMAHLKSPVTAQSTGYLNKTITSPGFIFTFTHELFFIYFK